MEIERFGVPDPICSRKYNNVAFRIYPYPRNLAQTVNSCSFEFWPSLLNHVFTRHAQQKYHQKEEATRLPHCRCPLRFRSLFVGFHSKNFAFVAYEEEDTLGGRHRHRVLQGGWTCGVTPDAQRARIIGTTPLATLVPTNSAVAVERARKRVARKLI